MSTGAAVAGLCAEPNKNRSYSESNHVQICDLSDGLVKESDRLPRDNMVQEDEPQNGGRKEDSGQYADFLKEGVVVGDQRVEYSTHARDSALQIEIDGGREGYQDASQNCKENVIPIKIVYHLA